MTGAIIVRRMRMALVLVALVLTGLLIRHLALVWLDESLQAAAQSELNMLVVLKKIGCPEGVVEHGSPGGSMRKSIPFIACSLSSPKLDSRQVRAFYETRLLSQGWKIERSVPSHFLEAGIPYGQSPWVLRYLKPPYTVTIAWADHHQQAGWRYRVFVSEEH